MRHQDLIYNHILESWTYPNALARTGASGFVTGDVGRIAYQQDTREYYRLGATTPTWQLITPAFALGVTGNVAPTSITSATAIMMGFGNAASGSPATLTPSSSSGKALVLANGGVKSTGSGTGGQLQLYYGPNPAPAYGDPATGTIIGGGPKLFINGTGVVSTVFPYTLVGLVAGLATGITYWFDIAASVGGGATLTLPQTSFTIVELP